MNGVGSVNKFDFPQMTMGEFFDRLRSADFPNPTGGAAAVIGAMAGCNLLVMVLNLNLDGEEDPEQVNQLMVVIRQLEELGESFWGLMEQDIQNLDQLLHTENEKGLIGCASCETLLQATEKIAGIVGVIPYILRLNRKADLVCDLGTAYWLLEASARALGALLMHNLAKVPGVALKGDLEARYSSYHRAIEDFYNQTFYLH